MEGGAGTATERRTGGRFPCFDGLRAVAAVIVVMYHLLGLHGPNWVRGQLGAFVSCLGHQGVGIFFVISGFLLYRPFVDAAIRGTSGPPLGPFWLRRFVRIFPAYWIALTAWVYFFGVFTIHGFVNFLTYYGLLENYRNGYALFGLGVAWTLVIEVSFYLALPLINLVARSIAGPRPTAERTFRVQIGVVATLAAIGLVVRALNIWIANTEPRGAWFSFHTTGMSLLGYLDWFAIGMTFAVFSAFSAHGRVLPKPISVLGRHPTASWVIAFALFTAQTRVTDFGSLNLARFWLPGLIGLAAGFAVFPAVFGDQDTGAIRRFLRTKPMLYLGGISYGIYLWHFIFISMSFPWAKNGHIPHGFLARAVVVVVLTLATASASFYLVEKPLVAWSHRMSQRRPRRSASSTSASLQESNA
jgi:peptidoglycan/LPS O-acetylase OafA/YrhL